MNQVDVWKEKSFLILNFEAYLISYMLIFLCFEMLLNIFKEITKLVYSSYAERR